jgi:hypothetical protein
VPVAATTANNTSDSGSHAVVGPYDSLPTQKPNDDRDRRGACAVVETSVPAGSSHGRGRGGWPANVRCGRTRGSTVLRTHADTRNSFALRRRVSEKIGPMGACGMRGLGVRTIEVSPSPSSTPCQPRHAQGGSRRAGRCNGHRRLPRDASTTRRFVACASRHRRGSEVPGPWERRNIAGVREKSDRSSGAATANHGSNSRDTSRYQRRKSLSSGRFRSDGRRTRRPKMSLTVASDQANALACAGASPRPGLG